AGALAHAARKGGTAKRVLSLGNAVVGVMHGASLSIHAIGEGLAASKDLFRKHSVKQVDRLLSNSKLDIWELFALWVPYVIGERNEAVIALRSEEHTSELQSRENLVCRLLLEKKKKKKQDR